MREAAWLSKAVQAREFLGRQHRERLCATRF
jgi:hypothetical protein